MKLPVPVLSLLIILTLMNADGLSHEASMGRNLEEENVALNPDKSSSDSGINKRDASLRTALHRASMKGDFERVMKLLEKGAEVNTVSRFGDTPISCAAHVENIHIIKLLLAHGADASSISGALISASSSGNIDAMKLLLENGAEVGRCALEAACRYSHDDAVILLLDEGAEVNVEDKNGATPLFTASLRGDVDVVKILIGYGADVNIAQVGGLTPLWVACAGKHAEIVDLLLQNGADCNAAWIGLTPRDAAQQCGHSIIVKLLDDHRKRLQRKPAHAGE